MTTETILSVNQIERIASIDDHNRSTLRAHNDVLLARAIEQAVLQSDHIRNMQGMADCMAMVRQEFIEAGVIIESVPPMMVSNAVLFEMQALRKDAERYRHAVSSVSEGRVDICVCQIEWDIEGIDAYTFLIGSDADSAIDAAMEQQT